jgi:hypothetical protein
MALASFFEANVGTGTGIYKDAPEIGPIALGQISLALLLTLAIMRWGGDSRSVVGGFKVGVLFGFLIALGVDLTMYGTTNVQNLTATLVDPLISAVLVGVTGAVIGMILSRAPKTA